MIGIYKIECVNDKKIYIGQSINIKQRFQQHISDLKANRHKNEHLQNAVNKYGIQNFKFDVLVELKETEYSKEKLDQLEIEIIKKYNSNTRDNGYNIDNGGNSIGKISEETKHKLSIVNLGKKHKPHSIETRMLMRKNHSHYWKGKHLPDYVKKHLSDVRKGRPSHLNGRNLSVEHKNKISQSQIGAKWMNKDGKSSFVNKDKINKYIKNGYSFGRTPFNRKVNT